VSVPPMATLQGNGGRPDGTKHVPKYSSGL